MLANDTNSTHHRHPTHRGYEELSLTTQATDPTSPIKFPSSPATTKVRDHHFGQQFKIALSVAGMAASLLVTTFGLFHVDVFLRVYRLPLHAYSVGNLAFTVVNTTNDLLGAWLLDAAATKINRSDLIGVSGCIFALCFLTPFFRWNNPSAVELYDEAHFIISMSMYDTLNSFTAILLGSLVTDNHHMTDRERVNFMASGKILNLVSAFVVARIGLTIFDEEDMHDFRVFLVVLAAVVAILFLIAQIMTHYHILLRWKSMSIRFLDFGKRQDYAPKTSGKLMMGQVVQDFWRHNNFWAWIGMELFLESQNSFSNAFLKTFVDRLVHDEGISRDWCDWLLSIIRPLGLVCGILCYIPIRRVGYKKVYPILFATNIVLCFAMLLGADHTSTNAIIFFLVVHPAITEAVAAAGFHLVMSDMVLEMKKMHALDGRQDEPSLAGLFMGFNALFCKPAESILPVVAANMLDSLDLTTEGNADVQRVLFKLLVIPPLIFSFIEWISWSRFTLTPSETSQMRDDLRMMELTGRRSSEETLA